MSLKKKKRCGIEKRNCVYISSCAPALSCWCVLPCLFASAKWKQCLFEHQREEQKNRRRQMGLRGVEDIKCVASVCECVYVCVCVGEHRWSPMQRQQQYCMHDTDRRIYALHKTTDGDRGSLCFPSFPKYDIVFFSSFLFSNNHCSSALTFCLYLLCFVIVIHRFANGIVKLSILVHLRPFWAKLSKDKIALWQRWNVSHSVSKMSTQDMIEEVLYEWQWMCISISKSVFKFRAALLTKGGSQCFQSWNNKIRKQN